MILSHQRENLVIICATVISCHVRVINLAKVIVHSDKHWRRGCNFFSPYDQFIKRNKVKNEYGTINTTGHYKWI